LISLSVSGQLTAVLVSAQAEQAASRRRPVRCAVDHGRALQLAKITIMFFPTEVECPFIFQNLYLD
jgi:hypothetical protein